MVAAGWIAQRHFPSPCSQQPGQWRKGVGGHRQDKAGAHPLMAAMVGLGRAAEGALDECAVPSGPGVAVVPLCAAVDPSGRPA